MFKLKTLISVLTLSIFFSYSSKAVESQDPIKLTLHDWTGQLITTNIMAEVLKEAGYNIELFRLITSHNLLVFKLEICM